MTETPQQDRVHTENLRDLSRLRRSRTDRKIAGVAGGIGHYLNIDPTVVRVVLVVLAFFGGAGLVLYGAAWLLVPEEGKDEAVLTANPQTRTTLMIGAAVVAVLLLLGDSWSRFHFPWFLVAVALVVFLFLANRDKHVNTQAPSTATPPTPPSATDDTTPLTTPATAGPSYPSYPPYQAPPAPTPRPDRGPVLFWFTLALVAVALGSLGLYEVAGGDVADAAYPALALGVVGAMLVVGAWFGRAGGLVLLGVVSALALAVTSTVNPRFDGPREVDVAPLTAAGVAGRYYVPAGDIAVDLTRVRDVAALDGRTLVVRANAGQLTVTVPEGVDVEVDARISVAGQINVDGESRGGTNVAVSHHIEGGPGAPQLTLRMRLVVGDIEVRTS